MSVMQIRKAESLLMAGRFQEAEAIVAAYRSAPASPDADLGLAFHQLGVAGVRKGQLQIASEAFGIAVEIREQVLLKGADDEVRNDLAGTHKMRSVLALAKLRSDLDPRVALEARQEIDKALQIRFDLFAKASKASGIPVTLVHDLAMTLNTKGNIEGTVRNFTGAMDCLEDAVSLMRKVVANDDRWLTDLGTCLADLVLFGVGARAEAGQTPPLKEAEECLLFFQERLDEPLRDNFEAQAKFLQFLGQAAAPAAIFSDRPDRARVFLEAGLSLIDRASSNGATLRRIAPACLQLLAIPPRALSEIVGAGLDRGRFEQARLLVMTSLR